MKSIVGVVRIVGLALATLLAAVLPYAPVTAGPYTVGDLTLSDATPAPGATIDLGVDGFRPNSDADVFFRSTPVLLASVTADAAGDVAATITIPTDASGEHRVEVVGVGPDGSPRTLSAPITVQADGDESEPLPSTGGSVAPTVVIAILAALVGIALLVVTRVRRRARTA